MFLTPTAADAEQVVAHAVLADELGLDLVAIQDHPYQATVPRYVDAALVRRRPDEPGPPRARRAQPAAAAAGGRRPRRREPGPPQRRPRRARPRLRRVLAGDRGDGRPAARPGGERRRARGGDRRDPRRSGTSSNRRRRASTARTTGCGARPAGRRRSTASRSGSARTSRGSRSRSAARRTAGSRACPTSSRAHSPPGMRRSTRPPRRRPRPARDRRLLNLGPLPADELARLALEDGVGTFILMGDDASEIRRLAEETAPEVRRQVERARA